MNKKTKVTVLKTFGKEDFEKILKKIVRDNLMVNLMDNQSMANSNFRSDL